MLASGARVKVPLLDLRAQYATIATGVVVETARFAIVRYTMRKSLPDAGAE